MTNEIYKMMLWIYKHLTTHARLAHIAVGVVFVILYFLIKKVLKSPERNILNIIGILIASILGTWVSDWDLLIGGIGYHRSPITHSFLPFVLFEQIVFPASPYVLPRGFALGLSSHLFWDIVYYGNVHWIPGKFWDCLFLGVNVCMLIGWIILRESGKIRKEISMMTFYISFISLESASSVFDSSKIDQIRKDFDQYLIEGNYLKYIFFAFAHLFEGIFLCLNTSLGIIPVKISMIKKQKIDSHGHIHDWYLKIIRIELNKPDGKV